MKTSTENEIPDYKQTTYSDSLQGVVYKNEIKIMDIYPNITMRYYNENTYSHNIIAEYTVDSIDQDTKIYRNANNLEEYFKIDNLAYSESENKLTFEISYSFDPQQQHTMEFLLFGEYTNEQMGGRRGIWKAITEIVEELVESGDEGGSGGGMAACSALAYATCNGCVAWVNYSSGGWFGSESCSYACA